MQRILGQDGEPNIDPGAAGRESGSNQSDAGFSNPNSSGTDRRAGSNARSNSNSAGGKPGGPSGPGPSTIGQATGGLRRVQITVEFDPRKLVVEMKRVAEMVTHRIVDLQNMAYAAQTKGTFTGRLR